MPGGKLRLAITGSRGIPARHGGFETFAERLALHLTGKGWDITVYCQEAGRGDIKRSSWQGVSLISIPVHRGGAFGTMVFDWLSVLDAAKTGFPIILTLGYNTAIFGVIHRVMGQVNLINMDGVEWKREKWAWRERVWLRFNELAGCLLGTHLIADHPAIADQLPKPGAMNKITMIPYGADEVRSGDAALLSVMSLKPRDYALVIARPEPENSILEIVKAFSRRHREVRLVLLGNYRPQTNPYHSKVISAASEEVVFAGAIYDKQIVSSLRYFARLYIHGHRVGGTNPSLVEALGAGSPVLAHENEFNLWVAGGGAHFFRDEGDCAVQLDLLLGDEPELARMSQASRLRFLEAFTWDRILQQYEELLSNWT